MSDSLISDPESYWNGLFESGWLNEGESLLYARSQEFAVLFFSYRSKLMEFWEVTDWGQRVTDTSIIPLCWELGTGNA